MTAHMRTRMRGGVTTEQILGTGYTLSLRDTISPKVVSICPRVERIDDEIHTKAPYEGGPMDLRRQVVSFQDASGLGGVRYYNTTYHKDWGTSYEGNYRCQYTWKAALPPSNMVACEAQGAAAWNKFRPSQPVVSLSIYIAELRDVPHMWFRKLNSFRRIGSNYLAVEFGWKPFLSELRKFWRSLGDVDRRIAQLIRDNGRTVRRGGVLFRDVDINNDDPPTAGRYIYPTIGVSSYLPAKQTKTTVEKCWFSGAFRYYIPGINLPYIGKWLAISELYDIELGPEQVYALIPWSWLFDWFGNLDAVIGNIMTAFSDNTVASYAYVMLQKEIEEVWYQSFVLKFTDKWPAQYKYYTLQALASCKTVTKSRAVADPFGFNFNWPDLSLRQAAILAALGLSRLKY